MLGKQVDCFLAALSTGHIKTCRLDQCTQRQADVLLIIDDQHTRAG